MPPSPRVWDGELYVWLSSSGELVRVDLDAGLYDVVTRMPAFVRGLVRLGDYVFVGCSLLRKSHTFGDLPMAKDPGIFCGVMVIHRPSGAIVGQNKYTNSCEEIYDVRVLPPLRRPGILRTANPTYRAALSLSDTTYWGTLNAV